MQSTALLVRERKQHYTSWSRNDHTSSHCELIRPSRYFLNRQNQIDHQKLDSNPRLGSSSLRAERIDGSDTIETLSALLTYLLSANETDGPPGIQRNRSNASKMTPVEICQKAKFRDNAFHKKARRGLRAVPQSHSGVSVVCNV